MSELHEKCVQLSLEGLRPKDIAQRLGCSVGTVHLAKNAARSEGIDLPSCRHGPTPKNTGLTVSIPEPAVEALERAAACRGVSWRSLVQRLVLCAAAEGLVDAILDDGVTTND